MRRRDFVLLGAAVLGLPRLASAQKKTPVIGLLWNDSVTPSPYIATLRDALRERGYVAGRDFRFEDRISLEGYGGYAEKLDDLIRAKVDLIVAYGATASHAAAKATKDIPIVMITGVDPVAGGLAASYSRPGGNVTGVATLTQGLLGKRIELLKELNPGLVRIGHVLVPNVANPANIREAEMVAQKLNLQVRFVEVKNAGEIEGRFAELAKSGVGAISVGASTLLASQSERVVAAVAKHRLPAMYGVERFADAGGLLVYSPSVRKSFVRLAGYVERVLKGARPADLAIEQSADLELVVNLKTAKALGIKIPQSILVRADRVSE